MENNHKETMKSISKFIADSSQNFFSSFLDDSNDKKMKEKERLAIIKKLQLAVAQKTLVVLQLKEDPASPKFETISGWVVSKNFTDAIMIRLQDDSQQIKMVSVKQIMKVSALLSKDHKRLTK